MVSKIAILTSGGDAPGMNAAIRAAARIAISKGWAVMGVRNGYAGLIKGDFIPLEARSVGGILHTGGTMLGSARSLEFKTEEGKQKALANLSGAGIDGLLVIGGNGSQAGANALHKLGFAVNGIASTIDNDLTGSDITIGVDTALNIALESIDRLKVTASSHRRAFLVEVMGRDCGYLALMAGIAGGAEAVVVPEIETTAESIAETIADAYRRGKSHAIVVVAEGAKNEADKLTEFLKAYPHDLGFELRAITLGHVQRGGAPFAFDRTLAARLAATAVEAMATGNVGVLAGARGGQMITTPLAEIAGHTKGIDPSLLNLAKMLVV
jgi:6-phosphofructokinase 1